MNDHQSFQRFAALAAIISFPLALGSIVLSGMALDFNMIDAAANPALWLSVGADGASLLRWGMILDMFSYYLPLLPVALFLWGWLGPRNPDWVRFYTFCGLGYILIGATGAVILAAIQPPLIKAYAQASVEQRVMLETVFNTIWSMVYGGMWNILGGLLTGTWFLGIGLLLRGERRIFSIVSMILGISALLDSLGFILGIEALALLGVAIYVLLAPFWTLWLGIDLLRKPVQIQTADN
jgi:Domain of unknown function (DUF4386)